MAASDFEKFGVDAAALLHGFKTAHMEAAAVGKIDGTGDVPAEDKAFGDIFTIQPGYGRYQALGIRMPGVLFDIVIRQEFDDSA